MASLSSVAVRKALKHIPCFWLEHWLAWLNASLILQQYVHIEYTCWHYSAVLIQQLILVTTDASEVPLDLRT